MTEILSTAFNDWILSTMLYDNAPTEYDKDKNNKSNNGSKH